MYYIEQQEDELVKYEVKINEVELQLLKYKIVTECGEINHHSYNSMNNLDKSDYIHVRNYNDEIIGRTEKLDDIYHIEYDEYKDTKLVTLIDKLLVGETNVIVDLKSPTLEIKEDEEQKIIAEIKRISNNIKTADSSTISELTEKISELSLKLKQAQQNKILNKNRKSDLEYYEEALSYIEFTEISRIKIEKLEEFNSLYDEVEQFLSFTSHECINSNINENYYKKMVKRK